jgi:F-type H+-transporting ATPase subunit b
MTNLLTAAMLLAQEEGGGEEEASEGIDLLLPESSELIAGILAFTIIFFFVWKWVLPAINKTLEARQQAITGQLQEAEKAKQEAEGLLNDYQAQLAGARSEADQIIDDARQTAESVQSDLVAKAKADADEITQRAQADAAAERERLGADLREEVATLSLDVAEKVVASSIDQEGQRALVDRYIDDLGGLSR